ncbi:hypothetical protein BDR07DRAFT_1496730 [Suillus spraguei]|nr:hypothetical protein BDR07DRAFT_1496730 [Suillus spraguei]
MLPNAKHVAHILSSDIVSAPLQHSLFSSDASSSAAAEPTAGPLAPSDELDEASSFAVILGVSAFIVLIVTYPLWKRKILLISAVPCPTLSRPASALTTSTTF